MPNLERALIYLAGLAFVIAVLITLGLNVMNISAEAFSRAANNLVLFAIAWMMLGKQE